MLAAGAIPASVDATILEPHNPRVIRVDIPLERLPESLDGLTIAQVSDFHYDEHFNAIPIRKAVEIVNGLQADLIVMTGDYVTIPLWADYVSGTKKASASAAEPCAQLLAEMRARLGRYAILGNHDADSDAPRIVEALLATGISVLRNASMPIEHQGGRLWLCGIDDLLEGRPDLKRTLQDVPPDETCILLAHEPDFADQVKGHRVDLQLSGHSHGGQVRVPGIGAPILPSMARKYPWGLRRLGRLTLYTNVGLGTIRLPVRFDCPPEITLITLRRQS